MICDPDLTVKDIVTEDIATRCFREAKFEAAARIARELSTRDGPEGNDGAGEGSSQ
jgi:hypothetical protein